jgi:hypothetical protein
LYKKKEYEKAEKVLKDLCEKFSFEINNDKSLKRRIVGLEKKIIRKKNPYIQQSSKLSDNSRI